MLRHLVLVLVSNFIMAGTSPPGALAGAPDDPAHGQDAGKEHQQTSAPSGANAPLEPMDELARRARKSVVLITVSGRDGERQSLGTGFVVAPDGLIATNLHVIGEARPIDVHFSDARKFPVDSVHAFDRALDLALLRIPAHDLTALPLGDPDQVQAGEPVVVLGNPLGLEQSVVSGVLSGKREVDGREMLQLAVPIEPGNSGSPVIDRHGRVQGVVTIKWLLTQNLGFAMPIDGVRSLLAQPNPIPMSRWLTIGALDPKDWTLRFGARWRQRAGRIEVSEPGDGFGGRSLCLSSLEAPEPPYELAVWVRLDDESGAAGLVFHADGMHRHYGFYPSAGRLRLSSFQGPDVETWQVLSEVPSAHYHAGQWNHLKVRLEKERILCFVNDQLVIESTDRGLSPGQVGLAKFRHTKAEFKRFQVAREVPPSQVPPELVAKIHGRIERLAKDDEIPPQLRQELRIDLPSSVTVLRQRASELDRQADRLRRLAAEIHVEGVVADLLKTFQAEDDKVDLARAVLLVARLDDDEVDVESYLREIDRMAAGIAADVPQDADEQIRLEALLRYLFTDHGFHGSRTDYYHRANSYLNRVIDDREGLPISLSVLTMVLGRRLGLRLEGVGLPGHFVVRHAPREGEPQLIDVFDRGRFMSREEAAARVMATLGRPLRDDDLRASNTQSIVRRMLGNLLGIAQQSRDTTAMLRYLDAIVAIDPTSVHERAMRAALRWEAGYPDASLADLDWLLEHQPPDLDLDAIRQMRERLRAAREE